jgi:hypothetical protein
MAFPVRCELSVTRLLADLQNTLEFKTGGVGERLKPAVLKNEVIASLSGAKST